MDTISNQNNDKDKVMTLDYEPSTPDSHNTGQVIYSNDEAETTENLLEDNQESKIDHNNLNFHIIQKTVKD